MARCCNCGYRHRGGPRASSVARRVSCPTFAEFAEHRTQVSSSGAARVSRCVRSWSLRPGKIERPKAGRSHLFERWPPITILICWDNNIIECAQPRCSARIYRSRRIRAAATRAVPMQRDLIDPVLWDLREQEPADIEAELRGPRGCERLVRWLPSRAHGMDFVSSSATESARECHDPRSQLLPRPTV